MEKQYVYLDHSATTAIHPDVLEAMMPYLTDEYGNPNSLHRYGQRAQRAIEKARRQVAAVLNCSPREIAFTGCGTESDNLAIRGVAFALREKGRHLITTPIEHKAVLQTVKQLEEQFGFEVTYLPVDAYGRVSVDDVPNTIRPDTILVSVMYANNEIGTIQPIADIGALCRERGVVFHTDAVQAGGYLPLDVDALNVDLMALSGHKFHAPKGVGVLYVRRRTPWLSTMTGGGQEHGMRSGTQNVAGIVGLGAAIEIAHTDRDAKNARLRAMRDHLVGAILEQVDDVQLTGHPTERLPGHASFVVGNVDADSLLLGLDLEGVAASSGSACSSGAITPSHVLSAIGATKREAMSALRLTLGDDNTEEEVAYAAEVVPRVIQRLRQYART